MIVTDTETSGLSPLRSSLLSLGAFDFENPKNTFYQECRAFDGAIIEPGALKVNGFTLCQATDKDKQPTTELIKNFVAWAKDISNVTLAGENVGKFDLLFILETLSRAHIDNIFGYRSVDLHTVCYEYHRKHGIPIPLKDKHSDISLNYTLSFVGLPKEEEPHNALTGAKLEGESFSRLLRKEQMFPEFAQYPIPKHILHGLG